MIGTVFICKAKKVGYLESTTQRLSHNRQTVLHTSQRMVAHVAGMGQNVEVEVLNEHDFDWAKGKLIDLTFKQTSPTGAVTVSAKQKSDHLDVTFTAAGESRISSEAIIETINTINAGELLAIDPNAGTGRKMHVKTFDASLQKIIDIDYQLSQIETRVLDGVPTSVRHILSTIPSVNIQEESVYAANGQVLESKIAGLFTMRLEDEKRAKDVGYSEDVLVTFVVPVDPLIDDPKTIREFEVTLEGADGYMLPQSARQSSTTKDGKQDVTIKQENASEQNSKNLPFKANDFSAELKPESLIQSDAPEIRRMAKEVVGDEKNSYRAAKKLLDWTYRYVEKAYVPAVSNALEVLKTHRGDCGEHAVLFVALARAAGIPARPVVGITYWPPGNGFGYHAWAEIYVGQWIAVDPTQDSMHADATHIQLAGGDLAEQARITVLIGKLKAHVEHIKRE